MGNFWHLIATRSEQRDNLAALKTIKQFRIYLIGNPFKVVTDCNAVRTTLSNMDLREYSGIQFEFKYRGGHKMSHADALSRITGTSDHISF